MTDETPPKEPLHELTLGRSRPSPEPQGPRPASSTAAEDDDLEALAFRCRAKAEAARRAAERQRRIHERSEPPDEDAASDPPIRAWADALTDAFYWASADDPSGTLDVARLDDVAGCFETAAEGLLLVRDRPKGLERRLALLAEAQSALRESLHRLKAGEDADQAEVFQWVKDVAARRRLYLKRFLRADDPADPTAWPDLLARIEALAGSGPQTQRQSALLDHLRSLCTSVGEERSEGAWRSILDDVDEWVREGSPPSSRELRELLLPILDELPDDADAPPGFQLVLREVDRYLATRSASAAAAISQGPSPSVREAARLLSGRSVVLIGGLRRPEAQGSLKSAFGLKELIWIATKEHQSTSSFEPAVARSDVALVMLAIRWSSHAFGDVKQLCDRHGKPLVRLPGGYNANQVAAQILSQCSGQFGGR